MKLERIIFMKFYPFANRALSCIPCKKIDRLRETDRNLFIKKFNSAFGKNWNQLKK